MTENNLPACPKCHCEYTYEDDNFYICPECAFEWSKISKASEDNSDDEIVIKDASGNILKDGDSVTVIKDLKVKGSSLVVKVGELK